MSTTIFLVLGAGVLGAIIGYILRGSPSSDDPDGSKKQGIYDDIVAIREQLKQTV